MELKNDIILTVGDWSKDGHNQFEVIPTKSSHNIEDIKKAYKQSVEKTGVDLSKEVCSEYGDREIKNEVTEKLKPYFDVRDFTYTGEEKIWEGIEFAYIYCEFIKISLPEFEYKFRNSNENNINIGGYGLFE